MIFTKKCDLFRDKSSHYCQALALRASGPSCCAAAGPPGPFGPWGQLCWALLINSNPVIINNVIVIINNFIVINNGHIVININNVINFNINVVNINGPNIVSINIDINIIVNNIDSNN